MKIGILYVIQQMNHLILLNLKKMMMMMKRMNQKVTLRTTIDNSLYKDEERLWRLFLELIEGLAHIHQQGMITS